jgi:5-aminopentanamidase
VPTTKSATINADLLARLDRSWPGRPPLRSIGRVNELPTRVAAWQCRPGSLDVAGNLRRLDAACALAAARQATVLVTPEMFTSGYAITPDGARQLAEPRGGPTEAAVSAIARRHQLAIAYGHPERGPDGSVYNAATLVGADGAVRGRHRKVHLYGDLDRAQFTAGREPPAAFDLDGAQAGMLICYDVEFPEAVRRLAVDGAKTVLVPTANMAGCEQVQEFLVRARACENGCAIVYANYCGADDVFQYNGRSTICGPRGEVLAQAAADGEELIVADLSAGPGGSYLADRRPELYATGRGEGDTCT